ncbi:MAG TPA: energy transducer TonB [Terracidiphilus sp.]|nr:energy transducer TonB [Terracidiphilus sp.]
MFEDSTFESTGAIRTRSRRWMLATLALNGSILVALILIPLIYPEALPSLSTPVLMTAPVPPVDEPRPQPAPARPTTANMQAIESIQMPTQIPTHIRYDGEPRDPGPINLADLAPPGNGTASADSPWGNQPHVVIVQQPPKGPTHVSQGVMAGLLLNKVVPVYPPIAKATGTQGTVVLQATISKNGTIENLRVLSGSPMLQQAAIDAVRQWIYRPYLLNGSPVDVETTVNVVFTMN